MIFSSIEIFFKYINLLFTGWLADADKELYSLFREHASVETYDKQETCVLHLLIKNTTFSDKQRETLSAQWKEYSELFNVPVNEESMRDLSGSPLKEIFNRYSGLSEPSNYSDDVQGP